MRVSKKAQMTSFMKILVLNIKILIKQIKKLTKVFSIKDKCMYPILSVEFYM